MIVYACEPNFRDVDSKFALFRVGGFHKGLFDCNKWPTVSVSIKVDNWFIRVDN